MWHAYARWAKTSLQNESRQRLTHEVVAGHRTVPGRAGHPRSRGGRWSAVQVRRGISRTPLAPLEVAFCAPFRGEADVLADFHELLSTLEQKVLPARVALPGGPTRARRDRVVYHAMIRGEPAIGHEQSRANHACIRLNPYRVPTMKQSYASAGKAPRRWVHSPGGFAHSRIRKCKGPCLRA